MVLLDDLARSRALGWPFAVPMTFGTGNLANLLGWYYRLYGSGHLAVLLYGHKGHTTVVWGGPGHSSSLVWLLSIYIR